MTEIGDLVVTHTDRDGLFSATALPRALGASHGPAVFLTQPLPSDGSVTGRSGTGPRA